MTGPAYHGWTHRPKSEGGTDPIPISADLKWAKATMFDTSTSGTSDRYRVTFDTLGTNDTSLFELGGISGSKANWLQINSGGYYVAIFGMDITSPGGWGAQNAQLIPLVNVSGDVQLDTQTDGFADWNIGQFTLANVHPSSLTTTFSGLEQHVTFNYDPGSATDLGSLSPLSLAMRIATADIGAKTLVGGLFVMRIASAGYTLTDL